MLVGCATWVGSGGEVFVGSVGGILFVAVGVGGFSITGFAGPMLVIVFVGSVWPVLGFEPFCPVGGGTLSGGGAGGLFAIVSPLYGFTLILTSLLVPIFFPA